MTHPFLDLAGPVVIAHRGASALAPENTLEAFQTAVDLGCRVLETDVHVTRDGVVVAFHDHRLDRQTDRRGEIEALTIAEVERADAGFHFAGANGSFPFRDRGVRVPRLEQILERFPDTRLVIDPKTDRGVVPLAALLERFAAWDRVCVGAFSDRRLVRIRRLGRGRACTSMGPAATAIARAASLGGRLPRLGADCLQVPIRHGPIPLVTERFVRAAHRARLPVQVWTIDDAATMRRLLDLGADAVMTNRPALALEIVGADGSMQTQRKSGIPKPPR